MDDAEFKFEIWMFFFQLNANQYWAGKAQLLLSKLLSIFTPVRSKSQGNSHNYPNSFSLLIIGLCMISDPPPTSIFSKESFIIRFFLYSLNFLLCQFKTLYVKEKLEKSVKVAGEEGEEIGWKGLKVPN